ncbi:hypothetical protein [Polaribacter tangerinus]|uniref:hypothetical protein n=1 Tax=Polaribacter tangerinus TaxID=1920034 RepID=UPI000B4AC076|nr:hypothetical protein [Polaribacter tangerinus]
MENILKYYEFSDFLRDTSGQFSSNEISYSELNDTHFLIFERKNEVYNLYVAKYVSKNFIGKMKPEIIELLVKNYDKSIPEHRLAIKQYLN